MSATPRITVENAAVTPQERAFRKVYLRLTPFLLVSYVLSYLDRTNIGIAQLQLKQDIGMSDAAYGFGAGIFYVGYLLSELPSNLMLARIGARRTFARIMIFWGLVEVAMMFVKTPQQFYMARVVLGFAEGGFFPGILLYLSYWVSGQRRARVTALFLQAFPVSFLVGAPLGGWIMERFAGVNGWHGWQWLFLLEGIPPILMGILALLYLNDKPGTASWLDEDEKQAVLINLKAEQQLKSKSRDHYNSWTKALLDPRVYFVGFASFSIYVMTSTLSFWSPVIVSAAGVSRISRVGLLLAIPAAVASVSMYLVGRHSDSTLERRWHATACMCAAALGCALLPKFSDNVFMSVALLSVAMAGIYSAMTVFFTVPSAYLAETAAAGGIALVTMMGALGAAIGPIVLGALRTASGNLGSGLYLSAAVMLAGSLSLLVGIPARVLRER